MKTASCKTLQSPEWGEGGARERGGEGARVESTHTRIQPAGRIRRGAQVELAGALAARVAFRSYMRGSCTKSSSFGLPKGWTIRIHIDIKDHHMVAEERIRSMAFLRFAHWLDLRTGPPFIQTANRMRPSRWCSCAGLLLRKTVRTGKRDVLSRAGLHPFCRFGQSCARLSEPAIGADDRAVLIQPQ